MKKHFRSVNRVASKIVFTLALAAMLATFTACGRNTTENAPEDMVNDTTDGGDVTGGNADMMGEGATDNVVDESGYVSGNGTMGNNTVDNNGVTNDNTAGGMMDDAGNAVGNAIDDAGNAVGDVVEGAGNVVEDVGEGVQDATRR